MGASKQDYTTEIASLLSHDEVVSPDSPLHEEESQTWSAAKDMKPTLVVRPRTIQSLGKVIAYLFEKDLDYAVRSQGYGSASAKDVLISLSAFDQFEFDKENATVTLGVGQPWRGYYERMEKVAPDWTSQFPTSLYYHRTGHTEADETPKTSRYRTDIVIQWSLVAPQQSVLAAASLLVDSRGSPVNMDARPTLPTFSTRRSSKRMAPFCGRLKSQNCSGHYAELRAHFAVRHPADPAST